MPGRPSRGRAGSFYMAPYKGGGKGLGGMSFKGGSSNKELTENTAYGDEDLAQGAEVTHDFSDSNFDANEADNQFLVGGGGNWFSRIFNPPNETAIAANNNLKLKEAEGELGNAQLLHLEEARRKIDNEIMARSVAPLLGGQMDSILGNGAGMLNDNALGERIGMAMGPQIRKEGAALAIPQTQAQMTDLGYLNQLNKTPEYQRFADYSVLSKLHPRVQVGDMVVDAASDRVYEGNRLKTTTRPVSQDVLDPVTGKVLLKKPPTYVKDVESIAPKISTFGEFQAGDDEVKYDDELLRSILQPRGAVQPPKPKNEKVTSPEGQPEISPFKETPSGYMDDPNLAPAPKTEWTFEEGSLPDKFNHASEYLDKKGYEAAEKARKLYRIISPLIRHLTPFGK